MAKAGLAISTWFLGFLLLATPGGLHAAGPPALVNYQGVLRTAADEPVSGAHDMTFRFFDSELAGNELLVDSHLASDAQAVVVDGGLFSAELGGGRVADGSGAGTYGSLSELFHDHDEVWLEVEIDGETLAPRTRVLASAYSLSSGSAAEADQLDGHPSGFFLDSSSVPQVKSGPMQFHSSDPGQSAVEVTADSGSPGGIYTVNALGSYCNVAHDYTGLDCRATGSGGFFYDLDDTSYAFIANAGYGVYAAGPSYGAVLTSNGGAGVGVFGRGPVNGGYFLNTGSNSEARLGASTYAVDAHGPTAARFVQDGSTGSYLYLGYSGYGILGKNYNGIHEIDITDSSWSTIGASPYKVQGNGSVSFVQNHPDDPNEVVIYHAPESSEVNVYTRGSAKLDDGVARVDLDPTFAWTANPDIGLTAQLTPRDEPVPLAVEEVSSSELVVRGPKGSDAAFDYQVTGLRIGFEEMPAVSPKKEESWIPLHASGEDVYAKDPELRGYNALERYRAMAAAVGRSVDPELKAAADLKERIGFGRPSVDPVADDAPAAAREAGGAAPLPDVSGARPPGLPSASARAETSTVARSTEETTAPQAARRRGETFIATSQIEAGDVVVLDPTIAGAVRRCDGAADRMLVGVAVAPDRDGVVEVAVSEIHEVFVDASDTPIQAGDFLTTSATGGAAMRAETAEPGTILGKALEPLGTGLGTIRVLLLPR